MNKAGIFLLMILAVNLIFQGCDKVENPLQQVDTGPDTTGLASQYNDTTWNDTLTQFRRIVLEDYTGHTCGNCPAASDAADALHDQYGDTLLIAGIHAGDFANPENDYPADYRTPAGDAYDGFFKVSTLGNPNGLINRRNYTAQNPAQAVVSYPAWGTTIDALVDDPNYMSPPISLVVRNIFNTDRKISTVTIKGKVNQSIPHSCDIVVWVLESGIVSNQKDYSKPLGQQNVANYVHNHVLRKSIPDTWGPAVISGSAVTGDVFESSFSFEADEKWVTANCEMLVIVYNSTNREIIQAAKLELSHE